MKKKINPGNERMIVERFGSKANRAFLRITTIFRTCNETMLIRSNSIKRIQPFASQFQNHLFSELCIIINILSLYLIHDYYARRTMSKSISRIYKNSNYSLLLSGNV